MLSTKQPGKIYEILITLVYCFDRLSTGLRQLWRMFYFRSSSRIKCIG